VLTVSDPDPATAAILADPRVRNFRSPGPPASAACCSRKPKTVISCSTELGGNAPFVVFDDADLEAALDGYWRMFSKRDYAYIADAVTAAGAIAVIVDYALMPQVRMAAIVDQVRRAERWIAERIADHGGDPSRHGGRNDRRLDRDHEIRNDDGGERERAVSFLSCH
jgi:acyl-CoA reductase-like NAD-dependent aldehyde dehydrogenase